MNTQKKSYYFDVYSIQVSVVNLKEYRVYIAPAWLGHCGISDDQDEIMLMIKQD